jgi:lipoprotein-anchoring transpeptidase ErfK/SrfK
LVVRNPGATRRRWLVVLLLVVAAVAAPVAGAAKPKAQKTIVVSVGQQMLWAYKGDKVVLSSYVSTGRASFDTPFGSFAVLSKLPSQTMEGVIGGEYYNVPDVPWVLYFTNSGHALHGTYWHDNFGTPMSHGCVNLPLDVAAWLYDWAPVGTPVRVVA